MKNNIVKALIDRLLVDKSLSTEEYKYLIDEYTLDDAAYAREKATLVRKSLYGNSVYIRGLIEISNYCKNGCLYCGINRSNKSCIRYRLEKNEILDCCQNGYKLGFRTFVMQGGEDGYFSDDVLCDIIHEIKNLYPDCAVTLSLGERTFESYKRLKDAGADRYLLRHETADSEHYSKLHTKDLSYDNRMECLYNLKKLGYQTGCGMMIGSPYQTSLHLAKDLKFIEEFNPQMCGLGPFLPHKDTIFSNEKKGSLELTLFLLSVIRIMKPGILLPSTTALGTLTENGRELGITAGANVLMPNLSPDKAKDKYMLYDNKLRTGLESAEQLNELKKKIASIGYEIVCDRGDPRG